MKNRVRAVTWLLIVYGLFTAALAASIEPVRINDVRKGELLLQTGDSSGYQLATSVSSDVWIDVTGPVARATVIQRFTNPSSEWAQGLYAFPLPEDAAVDHMRMRIGERIIEGFIQERQEAKRIHEQARREGKRSSLVEQIRPNLFTTSVANIPPQGTIEIEIEYQELLEWRDGQFSFRFPMAMTPRYVPESGDAEQGIEELLEIQNGWALGAWVNDGEPGMGGMDIEEEPIARSAHPRVSLVVTLDAGFPIALVDSLYHSVTIKRLDMGGNSGKREIRLSSDHHATDHDFELVWNPRSVAQPRAVFFTEKGETESHGLLMVMPPKRQPVNVTLPREVTYIIDTSGSMAGPSMDQAKKALRKALARLLPTDRFNVIEFNGSARSLLIGPLNATHEAIRVADHFVVGLEAEGGTEMLPALEMALDTRSEPIGESSTNYLRQVVFITDGAVGNEQQLFRYIHEHLGDRRLFTVGIGSAPNSYFMHKAAKFGRGTYTFIGDLNEVEERMDQLFEKMAQPTLTNLEVEFEGTRGGSFEMFPGQLPDLYQGEPVVVSMKMSDTPQRAVLRGTLGGRPWKTSILLKSGANQAGIGVLFGRRKIESWMNRRVTGTDEEQVSQAIVELGFDYHLVTRYTSLVAVDVTPIREVNDPDLQRPPGQPSLILARTGTSSMGQILLGLMLLIVFLILFRPTFGRSRQLVTSNT